MTAQAAEETVTLEDFAFFTAQQLAAAMPMFRLTAMQYDVWNVLLGAMQRGNRVFMTLDDMADRLGAQKPNISPALTVLRQRGLVWREAPGIYRVNPRVAFKGSVEEWNEAMAEVPDDVPDVVLPQYKRRPPRAPRRPGGHAALRSV